MILKTRLGKLLLFSLTIVVLTTVYSLFNPQGMPEVEWKSRAVAPGDTMWSIATQSDLNKDIRDIVAFMADYNGISNTGAIQAGDVIKYPILKSQP